MYRLRACTGMELASKHAMTMIEERHGILF